MMDDEDPLSPAALEEAQRIMNDAAALHRDAETIRRMNLIIQSMCALMAEIRQHVDAMKYLATSTIEEMDRRHEGGGPSA